MSQIIQLKPCWKCGKINPPKINIHGELVYPEKCRNPECRSNLDRKKVVEGIKKRMQNLGPHPNFGLGKITNPKIRKKKEYFFCKQCELFFGNQAGLDAHNKRRHS